MRRTCSLWPTDARAAWAGDMVGPAYFPGKITMHYFGRAPSSDHPPTPDRVAYTAADACRPELRRLPGALCER